MAPELNRVKIGFTTSKVGIHKRFRQIQCSSPCQLKIHSIRKHPNAPRVEREIHNRFKRARVIGEWFNAKDPKVKSWLNERIEKGMGGIKTPSYGPRGRPPTKSLLAIEFLHDLLQDEEEVPASIVIDEAASQGISKRTLENAKAHIGVTSIKRSNKWYWILSGSVTD